MPPSGLDNASEMVPYCLVIGIFPLYDSCALSDSVHGPSQLLRAAAWPIWSRRQFRTLLDELASSERVALASDASLAVAGSKTNARSFASPSPFTSPPTMGVKGSPDCRRPKNVSATSLKV